MRSPTPRSARVLVALAILASGLAAGTPGAQAAVPPCHNTPFPLLTNFPLGGQQPNFYYKAEGANGFFYIDPGPETCMNDTLQVDYGTTPVAPTTQADFQDQEGTAEWVFSASHQPEPDWPVAVPFTQDTFVEAAADEITAKLKSSWVDHPTGTDHAGQLGNPSQAPLYIVDDDGSTRVRFVVGAQSVAEDAGSVEIPMFRAGPTGGSVGYELVNGSASVATDLSGEPASGNFTFAPDLRMGTVELNLNDDALCEGSENLTVQFPSGTATDGPASVTLTIVDDDSGCGGTHTLTVTKHGTGGGTVTSSPAGINCGLDCNENYTAGQGVTLTAAAAGGSVFDHWAGACTGTSPTCNVTMNAAKTVQAWFTASGSTTHTLTVATNGTGSGTVTSSPAGINCPGDCTHDYSDGQAVTLTAAAGAGSTFAGWSGACSGTSPTCNVTMNADKSVTATFNTSGGGPFTLTVSKSGTGTVTSSPTGINCGRDCSQSYSSGTAVTLTAAPASGWSFSQWSGDCSGTSPTCNLTMNSAKNATAIFVSGTTFPLTVTVGGSGSGTVTSSPAGINCPGDCTQNFSSGQAVTLTAAAGGGSTFAGWSGNCSGTSPTCNLTMNSAKNVTATFDNGGGGTFDLTVSRFGQGAAQGTVTSSPAGINCGVNCSEAYPSGQAVTLTATAGAGWSFDHWEGDCSGTSPTCNLTMGSDKAVAAWFEDHTAPTSDFHHPKQGLTYDYDDDSGLLLREVHNFPNDTGSGMDDADGATVEIALRRKKTNNQCEWWNGSGFTAGGCAQKVWHLMTEYDPDAFLYHFPELTSSVGTTIKNYTAYSRATDAAGNVETAFIVNKNINTFEIAPNSP